MTFRQRQRLGRRFYGRAPSISFDNSLQATARNGLIAYYKLQNAMDSGPNGYHLTTSGAVSFANDGAFGKCASFSSNLQLLTVANSVGPLLAISPAPITIGFCFNLSAINANVSIIGKGTTVTREWRVLYVTGSGVSCNFGSGSTTTLTACGDYGGSFTGNLTANAWYMGFMWFDPSASANGSTSVHGGLLANGAITPTWNTVANASGNSYGTNTGAAGINTVYGTGNSVACNVNFLGVWNRLLTTGERTEMFANVVRGTAPF